MDLWSKLASLLCCYYVKKYPFICLFHFCFSTERVLWFVSNKPLAPASLRVIPDFCWTCWKPVNVVVEFTSALKCAFDFVTKWFLLLPTLSPQVISKLLQLFGAQFVWSSLTRLCLDGKVQSIESCWDVSWWSPIMTFYQLLSPHKVFI